MHSFLHGCDSIELFGGGFGDSLAAIFHVVALRNEHLMVRILLLLLLLLLLLVCINVIRRDPRQVVVFKFLSRCLLSSHHLTVGEFGLFYENRHLCHLDRFFLREYEAASDQIVIGDTVASTSAPR